MRRHNQIRHRAKTVISDICIGESVSVTGLHTLFKPEGYFEMCWRRERGGGPMLINLIHDIDMLRFLTGEIAEIEA